MHSSVPACLRMSGPASVRVRLCVLTYSQVFFFNYFQTGTTVKTLDITIRAWNGDVRFDVANDEIYRFTCTTDTTLPASTDVMNNFKYE